MNPATPSRHERFKGKGAFFACDADRSFGRQHRIGAFIQLGTVAFYIFMPSTKQNDRRKHPRTRYCALGEVMESPFLSGEPTGWWPTRMIDPITTERITSHQSPCSQHATFRWSELLDCLNCVHRTRRQKPASWRNEGRKLFLVGLDKCDHRPLDALLAPRCRLVVVACEVMRQAHC